MLALWICSPETKSVSSSAVSAVDCRANWRRDRACRAAIQGLAGNRTPGRSRSASVDAVIRKPGSGHSAATWACYVGVSSCRASRATSARDSPA